MLEKITDTRFLLSCFSLIEFCKEIQTLVQEGYLIEESNQGLPQGYMGHYSCVMQKSNEITSDTSKEETTKKTRKSSN